MGAAVGAAAAAEQNQICADETGISYVECGDMIPSFKALPRISSETSLELGILKPISIGSSDWYAYCILR